MPDTSGKGETKKYVRYIGRASVREITDKQWSNTGVKDQSSTYWNVRNGWKIPMADLSDGALDYLASDAGFVVDK